MVDNVSLELLLLLIFYSCTVILAQNWQNGNNGQVKWAMDCDFYGSDIGQQSGGGELCGGFCLCNSQCTHFTWFNNVCYMKRITNSSVIAPTTLQTAVCGYVVKVLLLLCFAYT